jgi:transposase-like protein
MESLLQQYESSEQTVAQFCAEHGLKVATFYYWRKKLRVMEAAEPAEAGFVAIRSQPRTGSYRLELSSGFCLRIDGGSPSEVAALIQELDRLYA